MHLNARDFGNRPYDSANHRAFSVFDLLKKVMITFFYRQENKPEINIFHSPELKTFQQALDGRLKDLQASQPPYKKKADAVSITDECQMWTTGVLGTHSPDTVINTLMFLTGNLFVLRGGKEQRELTHEQFQVENNPDGSVLVRYTEKVSKTNQGGLKRRKLEQKNVQHVEDPMDERSFSFIYSFYVNKW